MIGLLVVAHGNLAREILAAAEMIAGTIEKSAAVGIEPGQSVESIRESIVAAMNAVSEGGAIVMTDMFGGTPSNMSLSFLDDSKVEVVTGVNLPMVIEFASKREKLPFSELAAVLTECGKESILVAGELLRR